MGEAYDQVVAALPRLSAEERARVAERLRALSSLGPAQAGTTGPDPAEVLAEVICGVVLRMSGERVSPAALRRTRTFGALRDKARDLAPFLEAAARSRTQRRALLSLGFELLYEDLRRGGFSVTARTLMSCAHQLPAVLDRAFPGYARGGRLSMIVDASARGGENGT